MAARRLFAVIPAAGHSRRMGQPKLLLPFGGTTVIALMLRALHVEEITQTFVVVRQDDERLRVAAGDKGATVIQPPIDPPDMRTSVAHALAAIRDRSPNATDGWLLSPADHPCLDPVLIRALARQWQQTSEPILAPVHAGRRGHPTIFAWSLAADVAMIPEGRGLNWLVQQNAVAELPVEDSAILEDLDTPDDYARLRGRWERFRAEG